MKKDQIQIGGTYLAKVTDKIVAVRIDSESRHGGWDATNTATGKKVRIKSAQRLRGPAVDRAAMARATAAADQANARVRDERSASGDGMTASERAMARSAGKRISGLDAAYQILSEAGEPMRCGALVEKMLSTGMWKTSGKTPEATIYSAIVREIQLKGEASRFKKTDRGLFTANAR